MFSKIGTDEVQQPKSMSGNMRCLASLKKKKHMLMIDEHYYHSITICVLRGSLDILDWTP